MILFTYDKNGVYVRPISPSLNPAVPFKEDGTPNFLIPPDTTEIEPPKCNEGEVAVFSNNQWNCVEDKRGLLVYKKSDQTVMIVESMGNVSNDYTEIVPPSKNHIWSEVESNWVIDLILVRKAGEIEIDNTAEMIRNSVITPGSGQMGAYLQKEKEARELLNDENVVAEKYPFINAEVGITGDDIVSVAKVIVSNADAWWMVGAMIEQCRLQGKKDVNNALSQDEVSTIIKNINWPKV